MDWLGTLQPAGPLLERLATVLILLLSRVGGLVMTAPLLSISTVPVRVRALLALALTLLMLPQQWGASFAQPAMVLDAMVLVGAEMLIGVVLGLGVTIIISGVQLAGLLIGQLAGMSLADVLSPGFDEEIPLISQLLFFVTLAVFVTIGGHRRMIAALLSTFEVIPIGGGSLPPSLSETVTTLLGQSFALGVRAAAPAMTALLLSTLVMGLISRTLPQLNIMAFGFGLNAMVTLGALAVSLGAIAWIFQDQIDAVLETLPETLFRESAGEPSAGRMSHVPRRFA